MPLLANAIMLKKVQLAVYLPFNTQSQWVVLGAIPLALQLGGRGTNGNG